MKLQKLPITGSVEGWWSRGQGGGTAAVPSLACTGRARELFKSVTRACRHTVGGWPAIVHRGQEHGLDFRDILDFTRSSYTSAVSHAV